jgi:hypothetical protein
MTHPIAGRLLLGSALALAPILALAQAPATFAEPQFANRAGGTALFVLALVVSALAYVFFRDKRRQDLIGRFIDKGLPIPPELLPDSPSKTRERRRGSLLLALGLGLGFAVYFSTDDLRLAAAWSAVLVFLGAASFVNAALFYTDRDR